MRQGCVSLNSLSHVFAATAALSYAWIISQSAYVKTGFQFIMPVLVVMMVHLLWLALAQKLTPGFSSVVYKRSAQTALGMAFVIFIASIVAPQPVHAAGSDIVGAAAMVVFCVAIIAIIGGLVAFIFYGIYKGVSSLVGKSDSDGPENRLFDVSSLVVAAACLCIFSLEGHPKVFAFDANNRVVASHFVDTSPDQVWRTMDKATSPDFPLPDILSSFPQPTKVIIDEGTALGAMRQVEFSGREGTGHLTLKVIERTEVTAVFKVMSDTSPFANWVAHQRLIYEVLPEKDGTRLSVSLEYERLLAPAWFFSPITKGASYLAMDVLARDVKSRAEG